MLYASEEFYDKETFTRNCTWSHSKDKFWEMDSQDMGANRADSGSRSFWVEWACYLVATRGSEALEYAVKVQGELSRQFVALVPQIQQAASAINALVNHED